jgi:nucleoside-diphosphate-sugar epimerase
MNLAGRTALVTGATGFVGGALVRRLAAAGVRVRALARRPERASYIQDAPGVEIVPGDITQPHTITDAAQGCHYVFHVAVSYGSLASQQRVNVEGTRIVTEAAAGAERLVAVSSVAVYGYSRAGFMTEADTLTPTPYEPYSQTKAEAERVVQQTATQHNLSYCIIRPGMIYGPRSGQWTNTIFRHARRRPLVWIGDGGGSMFPIHIDDVVTMMMVLAAHPAAHHEVFNCVHPAPTTWGEYLRAYARLVDNHTWVGVPVGLMSGLAAIIAAIAPATSRVKALPHVINAITRQATVDMSKARDLLGWQPAIDLQTGIESCVPYLRERGWLS